MEDYRSGLASTKLNEYLGNVRGLNQQALQAGGLIAGAGGESRSTGTNSGGGLGKFVGGLLASDPRLKTDIERTGSLGVYTYRYKDDPSGTVYHGLMADEVERELPEAAGEQIAGFRTIDMIGLARAIR
jgi:hypothetical protein